MRRAVLLLAIVSLSLAACSSSSKSKSTSSSAATSSSVRTTTTTTTSTTAPAPSTTTASAATTAPPAPTTTATTGVKESVFIDSVDLAAHKITVDPMEFLTGPTATAAYHAANPGVTGGPPNDYFILNPTKEHKVLALDPKASVQLVIVGGVPHTSPVAVPPAQLATYAQLTRAPFWITIEHGSVTNVMEQFVP